jgi:hypothetical protein
MSLYSETLLLDDVFRWLRVIDKGSERKVNVCFCLLLPWGETNFEVLKCLDKICSSFVSSTKCVKFGISDKKLYVYKSFYEAKLGHAWMNFETARKDLF